MEGTRNIYRPLWICTYEYISKAFYVYWEYDTCDTRFLETMKGIRLLFPALFSSPLNIHSTLRFSVTVYKFNFLLYLIFFLLKYSSEIWVQCDHRVARTQFGKEETDFRFAG